MALNPSFIVRIGSNSDDMIGETMKDIRIWLDHRKIQPNSFLSVTGGSQVLSFEIAFAKEDEAYLFEREFAALIQ